MTITTRREPAAATRDPLAGTDPPRASGVPIASRDADERVRREWLVTNGLGGYASGTVAGAITRRFHGLLVAALPAPLGRMMLLNHLSERLRFADRSTEWLTAHGRRGPPGAGRGRAVTSPSSASTPASRPGATTFATVDRRAHHR